MASLTQLLDSVILIDHLNGLPQAKDFMLGLDVDRTAVSVISRAEILVGVEPDALVLVKAFLDQFPLLIIEKPIADLAASLRQTWKWRLPDAFQAALCLHHQLNLITRNTRDFNPGHHKFVRVPYEL
jgi:predicted nucleic acid-binding protein